MCGKSRRGEGRGRERGGERENNEERGKRQRHGKGGGKTGEQGKVFREKEETLQRYTQLRELKNRPK